MISPPSSILSLANAATKSDPGDFDLREDFEADLFSADFDTDFGTGVRADLVDSLRDSVGVVVGRAVDFEGVAGFLRADFVGETCVIGSSSSTSTESTAGVTGRAVLDARRSTLANPSAPFSTSTLAGVVNPIPATAEDRIGTRCGEGRG